MQRVENRVYTRVSNFQVPRTSVYSSVPARASSRDPRNRNSRNEWLIVANWFSSNLRSVSRISCLPEGLLPRHRSRLLIQADPNPKQTESVPDVSLLLGSVIPNRWHDIYIIGARSCVHAARCARYSCKNGRVITRTRLSTVRHGYVRFAERGLRLAP